MGGEDRGYPADPDARGGEAGARASDYDGCTSGHGGSADDNAHCGTDDNNGGTHADDGGADGDYGRTDDKHGGTDAHYLWGWGSPYDFVSAYACHKRPSLDGRLGVLSEVGSNLSPICDLSGTGGCVSLTCPDLDFIANPFAMEKK